MKSANKQDMKRGISIFFGIFLILLGIGSCSRGVQLETKGDKLIPVRGTVYAKSGVETTRYKSTAITTDFYVAVHPDDSKRYKDYDVRTTFACYSRLNVGDKVTFDVFMKDVDKDFVPTHPAIFFILLLLGSVVLAIGIGVLIENQ